MTLPTVCILAGGRGTRLGELVRDVPKPLLEVAGEPFLAHQLRLLASYGAEHAVLCVGYLGEQIERVIGTQRSGVAVDYSYDDPAATGTLPAVVKALPLLGERFLILYGDTYLRIDYAGFAAAWRASGLAAAMSVLHNRDRLGPSNAAYAAGRVLRYDKQSPDSGMEWIDYGLGAFEASAVEGAVGDGDLGYLYSDLASRGELFGYVANERFHEIGTPAALVETDAFLRSVAERAR